MPRKFNSRRYRRKKSGYSTAAKALSLAKYALKANHPEVKYTYWTETINLAANTPQFYNLISVGPGTGQGAMTGSKFSLRNCKLRFTLYRSGVSPSYTRIVALRYKEPGTPSSSELMQTSSEYALSTRNQNFASKFQVLWDKTFQFSGVGFRITDGTNAQIFKEVNFKCGKLPITMNNTNGSQLDGSFFLWVVSSDITTFNARAITYYTDA